MRWGGCSYAAGDIENGLFGPLVIAKKRSLLVSKVPACFGHWVALFGMNNEASLMSNCAGLTCEGGALTALL